MKTKFILFVMMFVCVGAWHAVPLQAQGPLPDTIWSKRIDNVNVVKFNPDGQYLFASTKNHGVNQLDALTGTLIRTIMLGNNQVSFSPTGDTVVLSAGNQISFININTGEIIDTIHFLTKGGTDGSAIITPDGKRIITTTGKIGLDQPQILVIDVATKQVLKTFIGRYNSAYKLDISPNGKYFSIADYRGLESSAILIDANTYEEISILGYHGGEIGEIKFSKDNKMIASCGQDGLVNIWDLDTKGIKQTLSVQGSEFRYINRMSFSNDSKYIFLANSNSEEFYKYDFIQVYNIESGEKVYDYPYPCFGSIDVSINDKIATAGYLYNKTGFNNGGYVFILNKKWDGTFVKEKNWKKLKYIQQNGKLIIELPERNINEINMKVYNLTGNLIKSFNELNINPDIKNIEIDFSFLSAGVYFLEIYIAKENYALKFLAP